MPLGDIHANTHTMGKSGETNGCKSNKRGENTEVDAVASVGERSVKQNYDCGQPADKMTLCFKKLIDEQQGQQSVVVMSIRYRE